MATQAAAAAAQRMRAARAVRAHPDKALRVVIHLIHLTLAAQAAAAHQRLVFNQMAARARHLQSLAQALIMRAAAAATAVAKVRATALIKAAAAISLLQVIQEL
jgi:hypothetical protein